MMIYLEFPLELVETFKALTGDINHDICHKGIDDYPRKRSLVFMHSPVTDPRQLPRRLGPTQHFGNDGIT